MKLLLPGHTVGSYDRFYLNSRQPIFSVRHSGLGHLVHPSSESGFGYLIQKPQLFFGISPDQKGVTVGFVFRHGYRLKCR